MTMNSEARKRKEAMQAQVDAAALGEPVSGLDLWREHTGEGYEGIATYDHVFSVTCEDGHSVEDVKTMLHALAQAGVVQAWRHHEGVFVQSQDGGLQPQNVVPRTPVWQQVTATNEGVCFREFGCEQVLWRLSHAQHTNGWEDDVVPFHYVITSSVSNSYAQETYAFPASQDGKIRDFSELHGSTRGVGLHEQVMADYLDHLNTKGA